MTAKSIVAVIDLQYGSTGKGQIAGTIAHHWQPDTVATAWGPNAGHTFRNGEFQMVSRMLASSAVAPSVENILIGPGSVVDIDILAKEIDDRGFEHLKGKNLIIHPQAVILRKSDAEEEQATLVRIGSTMKGTAEAAIRKIRREPDAVARNNVDWIAGVLSNPLYRADMSLSVSSFQYDRAVDRSRKLIVEGAQGFSLGLHTDFYPHTTGRDVSTAQMFADCRLPWPSEPWPRVHVIGVARTYPIRVANRFKEVKASVENPAGKILVGTSGGCYPDQEEISWESLGRNAELTTVTQLPRRIFTFSKQQIKEACRICRPTQIALTFCDYLPPETNAYDFAHEVALAALAPVRIMSQGPDIADVARLMHPRNELQPLLETTCDYLEHF